MKIKAILTMLIMLGGACMYALPDTADAARLGGGRSFGSRPSMSQPAQAPSAMQRQSTQQRQQAAQAQQMQIQLQLLAMQNQQRGQQLGAVAANQSNQAPTGV